MVAKATSTPVADEPDLLAGMGEASPTVNDDEDFDLLSDMNESDAQAWMPWDEEGQPDGIQGKVSHVGTVSADVKYGGGDVPYVELSTKDGTVWGIRGYGTVLGNQLEREIEKGLAPGHILAVKHLGMKQNRSGNNEYRNFAVKSTA